MITSEQRQRLHALLAQSDVSMLLGVLNRDGAETRIVGGAVRNTLLDMTVSDIDLATVLLPQTTMARAKAAGLRVVPTGIEHGTVTIVVEGRPFEATTLREDVATDGRHAQVRFGEDFAQDAIRRDFTINALSLDADGRLHDYAGGLADLKARRVRFIGDPHQRIREDYLRILRFFRFHAQYAQGPLDEAGYAASIELRAGLERLSRERIRQETLKLLMAPGAVAGVHALAEGGLLQAVIGGVDWRARFAGLIQLYPEADSALRLAALALSQRDDVGRLRELLRLTNQEEARLTALALAAESFHDHAPLEKAEAKALIYRIGVQGFRDLHRLFAASARSTFSGVVHLAEDWTPPILPFSGADVVALGIPKGPQVGRLLHEAEKRWIAAGFPADPAQCAALLREACATQE